MAPKRKKDTPNDGSPKSPDVKKYAHLSPYKTARNMHLPPLSNAPIPPASIPFPVLQANSFKTPESTPKRTRSASQHAARKIIHGNKNALIICPPFHRQDETHIGKLFVDERNFTKEWNIIHKLHSEDPQSRYLLYSTQDEPVFLSYADRGLQKVLMDHRVFHDSLQSHIELWIRKGAQHHEKKYRDEYPIWELTMPYGGIPLHELPKPIAFRKFVKYMSQVASGIQCMQQKRIVHQDIVPRNIVINSTDDTARIIDFGVAVTYEDVFDVSKNDDRLDEFYLAYPPEYSMVVSPQANTYWNNLRTIRTLYMKLHGFKKKEDVVSTYHSIMQTSYKKPQKVDVYSLGILCLTMMHDNHVQDTLTDHEYAKWMTILKGMTAMDPNKRWTIHKVIHGFKSILGDDTPSSPPFYATPVTSPYKSQS